MARAMNGLMHLERWIEQLVEEPFVRLFAGRLMPQDVVRRLVDALEDGERVGPDGLPEIPGRYQVELNPEDLAALPAATTRTWTAASVKLLTHWSTGWPCEPWSLRLSCYRPTQPLPTRAVDIRAASQARQQPYGTTIETGLTQDLPLGKLETMLSPDQTALRHALTSS